MTAAELLAHCLVELDAIKAKSSSPTVDAKAEALQVLLAAELPTLTPTILERRRGVERRDPDRPDATRQPFQRRGSP